MQFESRAPPTNRRFAGTGNESQPWLALVEPPRWRRRVREAGLPSTAEPMVPMRAAGRSIPPQSGQTHIQCGERVAIAARASPGAACKCQYRQNARFHDAEVLQGEVQLGLPVSLGRRHEF